MNHRLHTSPKPAAFKMSGGIYTLTTLELHATDTRLVAAQLREMTRKAPRFFDQTAVVLSFEALESTNSINLQNFRHLLYEHGMILVAIRGSSQKLQQEASIQSIAWLPPSRQTAAASSNNVVMMNKRDEEARLESNHHQPAEPTGETLYIDQPVRSGQQIYSQGDLVITASVSSGAELLAEGSIHVYGSLRGRALAGVKGDLSARIFCRQYDAELISIAGRYKMPSSSTSDDLLRLSCVQVYLKDKSLHIQKL